MNKPNVLWVCWKEPEIPPEDNIPVLSFLSPGKEDYMKNRFHGKVLSANEIAHEVKDTAREIYVNLIAKIGAIPVKNGKTLRQALINKDGFSLWWFHKASEKDCESDPTFKFIIEILIINLVANSVNAKKIVLYRAYQEIANILSDLYKVEKIECRRKYNFTWLFVKGIFSRLKYFFTFLKKWVVIKRVLKELPENSFDIAFSGFWDWSVKENNVTGELDDRFFKSLPEKLVSKGLRIGWFLWFEPYFEPFNKDRKLEDVLQPIKKRDNLILLQQFIKLRELIKVMLNIKPYLVFLYFCRCNEFNSAYVEKGINFSSLLKSQLHYGFLNSTIPHLELVYKASKKAFRKYKPNILISFQELFLQSRAVYAAAQKSGKNVVSCTIQHSSYSREKTFVVLEPNIEYGGYPDNCSVPKPDYIFAMGELGKEIFLESGFPEDRIFLTGSSRYEHINTSNTNRNKKLDKKINILLVTSLDMGTEMEMVEAVYVAAENMQDVQLFSRSHPFARMENHPKFRIYKDRIQITNGTLDEDLNKADLIIFSYSTVAEEAFIKGIPVWQWCSSGFNGSVFRDLKVIPSFNSITELRRSLKEFISNPMSFIPDNETRAFTLKKCFFNVNGCINERIADILSSQVYKANLPSHVDSR